MNMTLSTETLVVRDTVKEKVHTTVTHIHEYIDDAEVNVIEAISILSNFHSFSNFSIKQFAYMDFCLYFCTVVLFNST